MALRRPGETGPPGKLCYPPERLQGGPHLDAYCPPFPPYGHYGNMLTAAEEDFQPFPQLEAAVSASHAMPPFAFRPVPPLLSSSLALQREPLYDLPWYSKLTPWYPIPHLPREVPQFLNSSHEYTGATSEDLGRTGGQRDSGQCCGPETVMPPPAANASLLPDGVKASQVLSRSPNKWSEDGSKLPNQQGKSSNRYHFTQEDLNLVLFGVIPSLENSAPLHHAVSGFLVPTDSSGKGGHIRRESHSLGNRSGGRRSGDRAPQAGSETVQVQQGSVYTSHQRVEPSLLRLYLAEVPGS